MCKISEDQVLLLRCVIRCFEVISKLKVNLHKSGMYGVGKVDHIGRLADYLGCLMDSFPTTYLGLPLRASYESTVVWNPVIDCIQKRLAS